MRTALVVCALASLASAQRTFLVDVQHNGATPAHGAFAPDVSQAGRFVVFQSTAATMVAGDVNALSDVFARDMLTGTCELVSVSSSAAQGDGFSVSPRITPDARYVVFVSSAKNLAAPVEVEAYLDVFVRDRELGTTIKASVSSSGGEAHGDSGAPAISDDGARVCFTSKATDLHPSDTHVTEDVYVRDLTAGTNILVSRALSGLAGNGPSHEADISGNGRFVAFNSSASNLVAGDANGYEDVFVRDLATGTPALASRTSTGAQANASSGSPSISVDGRYVAFDSAASNLVPGDTNGFDDIFVRDLQGGATSRVNQSAAGAQADSISVLPTISADGRYVAFLTFATNLLPQAFPHPHLVARIDRNNGQVVVAATSVCGVPVLHLGSAPAISADGNAIVFTATDDHAAPNDVNNSPDVFLHLVTATPVPRICAYCGVAPSSMGCVPTLTISGVPSISALSTCMIAANSIDGRRIGAFVHSPMSVMEPWNPGGASFRCVDAWYLNGLQSTAGASGQCTGVLTLDLNVALPPWSQLGRASFVQAWIRDPGSAKGSSLAQAVAYVLGP